MLGTIMIFVGIGLCFIASLFYFFGDKVNKKITAGSFISLLGTGVILCFTNMLFFYAEPGFSYLVQYPWGTQEAVISPGYHPRFFGNLIPMKKVMTAKFYRRDELKSGKMTTGIKGPIPVRFNDAVTADVALSVRMRIPTGKEKFRSVAVDFRSQENLMQSSIIPFVREAVRNAARMLSAQDYISGKGGEFELAILDQIENGVYILETEEVKSIDTKDPLTAEDKLMPNRETVKYIVRIKRDENGNPVRKRHPLAVYGISITQAPVEDVDPEPKFKEMLAKQRDAAAQANVEKQQAKKAEYQKQRIIAEGESQKAQIRVEKEKEQIQTLIAAETLKKKATIQNSQREIELKTARLEAAAKKTKADADAYERERLMKADNALSIRLDALKEINASYAEAIKGAKIVPEIVISGSGKTSGTGLDLVRLLTAQTAKQISDSMRKK